MVMSASEKAKFINTFCELISEFIKTPEEIEKAKAEIELKNDTEMLTIKECSVIMRVSERTIRMLLAAQEPAPVPVESCLFHEARYSDT